MKLDEIPNCCVMGLLNGLGHQHTFRPEVVSTETQADFDKEVWKNVRRESIYWSYGFEYQVKYKNFMAITNNYQKKESEFLTTIGFKAAEGPNKLTIHTIHYTDLLKYFNKYGSGWEKDFSSASVEENAKIKEEKEQRRLERQRLIETGAITPPRKRGEFRVGDKAYLLNRLNGWGSRTYSLITYEVAEVLPNGNLKFTPDVGEWTPKLNVNIARA